MSPEQRAERIYGKDTIIWRDRAWHIAAIARAIRAAENAALERAAKAFHKEQRTMAGDLVRERIRSLKTRAPKRKEGRA